MGTNENDTTYSIQTLYECYLEGRKDDTKNDIIMTWDKY